MSFDTQNGVDDNIRQAHDDALQFRLAGADVVEMDDQVRDAAREEAETFVGQETVILDENGLTPGMRKHAVQPIVRRLTDEWLPLRSKFLTAIQPYKDRVDAYLNLRNEIEEKEREKARVDETIRAEFEEKPNWRDAYQNYQRAQDTYERESKKAGGRKAQQWPWPVYVLLLIAVGVTEIFINYELMRGFFGIPAAAFGTAIIFGIFFAGASHHVGLVLRAHRHYFGPDVEKREKKWEVGKLLFFHVFFVGAIGAIGYFRYNTVLDQVGGGGPLTDGTEGPPILLMVAVSLISNLLVYAVGALIAYLRHDAYPPLVAAEHDLAKSRRKFEKIDKHRRNERDQRVASLDRQIEEKTNTAEQDYKEVQGIAKMQNAVDEHHNHLINEARRRIDDALQTYQHAFAQALRGSGIKIDHGNETLDLDQYANVELAYPETKIRQAIGS